MHQGETCVARCMPPHLFQSRTHLVRLSGRVPLFASATPVDVALTLDRSWELVRRNVAPQLNFGMPGISGVVESKWLEWLLTHPCFNFGPESFSNTAGVEAPVVGLCYALNIIGLQANAEPGPRHAVVCTARKSVLDHALRHFDNWAAQERHKMS